MKLSRFFVEYLQQPQTTMRDKKKPKQIEADALNGRALCRFELFSRKQLWTISK